VQTSRSQRQCHGEIVFQGGQQFHLYCTWLYAILNAKRALSCTRTFYEVLRTELHRRTPAAYGVPSHTVTSRSSFISSQSGIPLLGLFSPSVPSPASAAGSFGFETIIELGTSTVLHQAVSVPVEQE